MTPSATVPPMAAVRGMSRSDAAAERSGRVHAHAGDGSLDRDVRRDKKASEHAGVGRCRRVIDREEHHGHHSKGDDELGEPGDPHPAPAGERRGVVHRLMGDMHPEDGRRKADSEESTHKLGQHVECRVPRLNFSEDQEHERDAGVQVRP